MNSWRDQWLAAIRAMTATPEAAAEFLNRRLRFTTAIARTLSHNDPTCDRLVYGVWPEGHESPVYIGQTTVGRRRLWDLPIGESHHLANSFPTEIWAKVVVVYWGRVLDARPDLSERADLAVKTLTGTANSDAFVGLGLEYLLQRRAMPLFNRR